MIFLEYVGSRASLSAIPCRKRAYTGDVSTPIGLAVRFEGGERAYTGDVSTPIGLAVRSEGGERAYTGDVGTPILIINCEKNVFSILI